MTESLNPKYNTWNVKETIEWNVKKESTRFDVLS